MEKRTPPDHTMMKPPAYLICGNRAGGSFLLCGQWDRVNSITAVAVFDMPVTEKLRKVKVLGKCINARLKFP